MSTINFAINYVISYLIVRLITIEKFNLLKPYIIYFNSYRILFKFVSNNAGLNDTIILVYLIVNIGILFVYFFHSSFVYFRAYFFILSNNLIIISIYLVTWRLLYINLFICLSYLFMHTFFYALMY